MPAQSASLTINVIANAAKAKAGFKDAEKGALSLKGQFDGLKSQMMGKAGLAMGFTAIAGFAMKAAGEFTALAKKTGDLAKATGLSVEQSSRWIAVADDFGVEAAAIQAAFKNINKDIDSSKWSKYGIQLQDASGNARKANDVFLDTLDVLNKIKDPTKRARIGAELLGKAWGNLAPLVGKSRDEYERMLSSVEAGQVITTAEYEKAEKLRLAQDMLADSWGELSLSVGQAVASMTPALEFLAKSLGYVGQAFAIVFGSDAESVDAELQGAAKRMAAAGGDVQELAFAFDELATASLNGRSSWDLAVEGIDDLTFGITTLGESTRDTDATAAALASFNMILEDSPANALAMAEALREIAIASTDPNSPKWMRDMDNAWNLNEETIDIWIGTARNAIVQEENLNVLVREQTDLLDGLASEWEDYLGLLNLGETADTAKQALLDLTYAIDDPTTATNEFAEAQKNAAEDVARFIKEAKTIPEDIQLKMLADLEAGDLEAVYAEIDQYIKDHPPEISMDVKLNSSGFDRFLDSLTTGGGSGGGYLKTRAAGGPVTGGTTYLVGEQGPELFTPPAGGNIIPTGAFAMAGGGGGVQNITIMMPAGANGAEVLRALQQEARRTGQLALPVSSKTVR